MAQVISTDLHVAVQAAGLVDAATGTSFNQANPLPVTASGSAPLATKSTFSGVAHQNDGTAPVSGGVAVKSITATATVGRKGILINNHSATDPIWCYVTSSGSAPTISSTTNQLTIPAGTDRTIALDDTTSNVWVISSSAVNTCAFSAVELI